MIPLYTALEEVRTLAGSKMRSFALYWVEADDTWWYAVEQGIGKDETAWHGKSRDFVTATNAVLEFLRSLP